MDINKTDIFHGQTGLARVLYSLIPSRPKTQYLWVNFGGVPAAYDRSIRDDVVDLGNFGGSEFDASCCEVLQSPRFVPIIESVSVQRAIASGRSPLTRSRG